MSPAHLAPELLVAQDSVGSSVPLARPEVPARPMRQPEPLPSRAQRMEALAYLRRVEKVLDVTRVEETVQRKVEERLEKKVTERVEHIVARELSADSPHARRLGERIYAGLYESLVLEKERLG